MPWPLSRWGWWRYGWPRRLGRRWTPVGSALLGALLGLCVLVKFQAYVALPLAAAVMLWDLVVGRTLSWRRALASGVIVVMVAAGIALPWLARNIAVYGPGDLLGLARHDAVVVGQLRTVDLIAEIGWPAYLQRFARDDVPQLLGAVWLDGRAPA